MSSGEKLKIGVVGAGLSGLACALELEKQGADVTIYEQSHNVGGRVQTDHIDGFKLDHGFQVYLTSYEMGQYFFNYKELGLKSFQPGAKLIINNQLKTLSDPLRNPTQFFNTILNPAANIKDKFLILKLKNLAKATKSISVQLNSKTTLEFLKDFGFSDKIITNFFQPFFAGVFLETELKTPAGFFLYLFGRFSSGKAALPENGMQSLATQLQMKLKNEVKFDHKAIKIKSDEITFENNSTYKFNYVVTTFNPMAIPQPKWNSVTTVYFKTKSTDFGLSYLYLNTNEKRKVNHVACLTAAQPGYAPKGWHLYSVNIIGEDLSRESDISKIHLDLIKIFGEKEIAQWQWIKSYYISKALPASSSFGLKVVQNDGVFNCGDYLESPSIQGALLSGSKTAQAILALSK